MSQKSKGKRIPMLTRLPEDLAKRIIQECDELGWTYTDYIAAVLAKVHNYAMPVELRATARELVLTEAWESRWSEGTWQVTSPEGQLTPASHARDEVDRDGLDRDSLTSVLLLEAWAERCNLTGPQFASALDIPLSRLEGFGSGSREVPAPLLLRAARLGQGLRRASAAGFMDPVSAGRSLRALAPALGSEDRDRTPGVRASKRAVEVAVRCAGDLRAAAVRSERLTHAWQAAPGSSGLIEWDAFLAALVDRQHRQLSLQPPAWASGARHRLTRAWPVPHRGLTMRQLRSRTPQWLAARRILLEAEGLPAELTGRSQHDPDSE